MVMIQVSLVRSAVWANATGMSFDWNGNGTKPGTGGRVDFTGDNSSDVNGNDTGKSGQVSGLG